MEVSAIIKNVAKNGKYYWVVSDFSMQRDKYGKIKSLSSLKRSAPRYVSENIQKLYDEMTYAERKSGMGGSLLYLEKFLDEKQLTYNEYLEELVKPKGALNSFMGNMKKVFS
jgi:hypothetical protein